LARVPSAHQVFWVMELLMKYTLPSAISTLQPPEWLLLVLENVASLG
jgi:hypothetical protein